MKGKGGEDLGVEGGVEGGGDERGSLGKMNEKKYGEETSMELIKQHKCDEMI